MSSPISNFGAACLENFFLDIAPQCATLVGPNPLGIVQLSAGGNAILAVPSGCSVDGKFFKIKAYVNVSKTAPATVGLSIAVNGTVMGTAIVPSTFGYTDVASGAIAIELDCFWDSTNQVFWGSDSYAYYVTSVGGQVVRTGQQIPSIGSPFGPISLATMADLQFTLQGYDNTASDASSFTVTQFSMSV